METKKDTHALIRDMYKNLSLIFMAQLGSSQSTKLSQTAPVQWNAKLKQSKEHWIIHVSDGDQQRLVQNLKSRPHVITAGVIVTLFIASIRRISITFVKTQLIPKITLHNFFCTQNSISIISLQYQY